MFNSKHLLTSTLLALAAGPFLNSALPVRRQSVDPNNVLVLRAFLLARISICIVLTALFVEFANVLEQLETTFYSQAMQKFQPSDFTNAGFSSAQVAIEQITAISTDEATHTTILQVRTTFHQLGCL
jgi:hypothetical protein